MGRIGALLCSITSVNLLSHHGATEYVVEMTSSFRNGDPMEIAYTCLVNIVGFAITYKGLRSIP
ncbi:MAG: hypothetical protein CL472_07590 [Acidobacteria bacterium]|nr:hypothetical protein [Acidobacteriota bacterium]